MKRRGDARVGAVGTPVARRRERTGPVDGRACGSFPVADYLRAMKLAGALWASPFGWFVRAGRQPILHCLARKLSLPRMTIRRRAAGIAFRMALSALTVSRFSSASRASVPCAHDDSSARFGHRLSHALSALTVSRLSPALREPRLCR
ncbi:hypothetical protein BURKHO8Y_110205 [Burkholderia sp. 8Y]|nr:hypothetical protein BURKHO8Y_110205 [Burkholderia sp. 8Y]